MRKLILSIIDFFHPLVSRWIPKSTFRYLACGGSTAVLDIFIYFISYNFILNKQNVHLPFMTISPEIAAFIISFSVSFPTGFLLNKYVVFTQSTIKGRIQLFRYALMVGFCLVLNYGFIKFFVGVCHIYPTIAKIITTVLVAVFSYFTQKNFTFKVKKTATAH